MSKPLERAMEVTGCDIKLAKRLAELFIPNCKNVDRTLRAHLLKSEFDEFASAVHKLKSGLSMFGSSNDAALCESLENSARLGNAEMMENLMAEFLETVDMVKAELELAMAGVA